MFTSSLMPILKKTGVTVNVRGCEVVSLLRRLHMTDSGTGSTTRRPLLSGGGETWFSRRINTISSVLVYR